MRCIGAMGFAVFFVHIYAYRRNFVSVFGMALVLVIAIATKCLSGTKFSSQGDQRLPERSTGKNSSEDR